MMAIKSLKFVLEILRHSYLLVVGHIAKTATLLSWIATLKEIPSLTRRYKSSKITDSMGCMYFHGSIVMFSSDEVATIVISILSTRLILAKDKTSQIFSLLCARLLMHLRSKMGMQTHIKSPLAFT